MVAELLSALGILAVCLSRAASPPTTIAKCIVHILTFWSRRELPIPPLEHVILGQLDRSEHSPKISDAFALLMSTRLDRSLLAGKDGGSAANPAQASGPRPLLLHFSSHFYHSLMQKRFRTLSKRAGASVAGDNPLPQPP